MTDETTQVLVPREVLDNLLLDAECVDRKYGHYEDGEAIDWTEWVNFRNGVAALREALSTPPPADDPYAGLKEKLAAFEGSDALGNGDFSVCSEALAAITTLQQRIGELEAENARLTEARQFNLQLANKALDQKEAAEQQIARLAEALKPFARMADDLQPVCDDSTIMRGAYWDSKAGDYRRAKAAIQEPRS